MALMLMTAAGLHAQMANNNERTLSCEGSKGGGNRDNGRRQERACEVREYPIGSVSKLMVDGRDNGGVVVKGWDRSDVLVRAKVETWSRDAADAKALASQVSVQSAGGNVRADAPSFGDGRGWAVSYEVFVPHRTGLDLKAHNGGISIMDVSGEIAFDTKNGGVNLSRLAGNVHGKTTNGGLNVELAGSRWDGTQLDVSTTNGGIRMDVPANYSARLETSTVNGGLNVDFPVTVSGRLRLNKELAVNLGSGGPTVRVKTVNGGVSIRKKS